VSIFLPNNQLYLNRAPLCLCRHRLWSWSVVHNQEVPYFSAAFKVVFHLLTCLIYTANNTVNAHLSHLFLCRLKRRHIGITLVGCVVRVVHLVRVDASSVSSASSRFPCLERYFVIIDLNDSKLGMHAPGNDSKCSA